MPLPPVSPVQRPEGAELQQLLAPVAEQMVAASDLASGPRSPYVNHFKTVAEAGQALSWVAYSGPACGARPARPPHLEAEKMDSGLLCSVGGRSLASIHSIPCP